MVPGVREKLRTWYRTPLGMYLEEMEKQHLDEILPDLFGYYLLQIGYPGQQDVLTASRVSNRLVMNSLDLRADEGCDQSLRGQAHTLPISNDSLDVMVLPHVLEFSDHPHQILREVDRALVPEGHVVIMGFNPYSLWLLWRVTLRWWGRVPWSGRFFGVPRVKDWLALLGFDVVSTRYYFFRPPMHHHRIMDKLTILETVGRRLWPILGGGYVLVAKKRVQTLTPIRSRWKSRVRLVASSTGAVNANKAKASHDGSC